jgi:predicted nuclease of restriction endonuclease-like (RecB) superfamily
MTKTILNGHPLPELKEYVNFFEHIKTDIIQTQLKATMAVTKEIVLLYWRIGKNLSEKANIDNWGTGVVETLARDIKIAFPDLTGFSLRNLHYMRRFFEAYPETNSAAAAAQIPWGHLMVLLDKLKEPNQRAFYTDQTLQYGWSRSVLLMWIESDLYSRQGKSITNFPARLPEPDSDLAQQALKDPYNFEFLTMERTARELEIERGLTTHIENFLLELGQGFSFLGRQKRIQVGSKEFFIDMLFYHLDLRCFIVIELKAREFDVSDISQINFYLSAVDDQMRRPGDNPSIGLLLCQSKDNFVAEYALRDVNKPIGVSSYTTKLVESLPKEFKGKLPTIEEIEAELEKSASNTKNELKKK